MTEASTSFKYSTLGLMSQIDGTGTTSFTRDNTGLLVGERLPGGSRFYYLYDGHGNVVGLTDSSGAVVSRLLKIGQHLYDPLLARWTQRDPVVHLATPGSGTGVYSPSCGWTDDGGTKRGVIK